MKIPQLTPAAETTRPVLSARDAAIALALAAGTLFQGSAAAAQLFAAPFLSFPTGTNPYSAPYSTAIGDLNGDGVPDLAVARSDAAGSAGNGIVSVLLGSGDGTFGTPTDFWTAGCSWSVAIGDLNGDGKPDLATTNSPFGLVGTVSVLLGNGDGTFSAHSDFETGRGPVSVAIGDLNGDGKPDLAVANHDSWSLSVLLGKGDGTFEMKTDYGAGGNPEAVAIGDLNGDGKLDMALAAANGASVLLGNGDGTFGPQTDFGIGRTTLSVAIGDLNRDGKPDLALTTRDFNAVSVLFGNGDGTFGARSDFGTGREPSSVVIGDLNGDDKADLAVANNESNTVSVLLGNGDGTFVAHTDFGTGSYPSSVAIEDLNGDRKPDLALANYTSNAVSVLLGNGDGTFGPRAEFGGAGGSYSVAIGDLNGDGKPDLAVANGVPTVSALLGSGDGTFAADTEFDTGGFSYSVAIGDLNADGKLDLAVGNPVSVLLGNGDGSFGAHREFASSGAYSVAIGDLNGDAKPDLVTANGGSNTVSVLLGNGDGTFGAHTDFVTGGLSYSVAIGDLNGDGKLDLVVARYTSGGASILLGKGDGTFGPRTDILYGVGLCPSSVAIGDLNGDGKPDLALAIGYDTDARWVSVLLGNGDGTFRAPQYFGTGFTPSAVAIRDLNGDGKPDLAVANSRSNTVSVLLGSGDGTFGTKTDFGTGSDPRSVAIGDLNGDGRPDLAVASSGFWQSKSVSVLLNTGSAVTATLLAQFDATPRDNGIELHWSFGDRSRVSSVAVERAPDADGPWTTITPELRQDGDVTAALDRTADPGQAYFYRLSVKLLDGTTTTFGPVSSTASASISESAITLLGPNPTSGRTQIRYAVARRGPVRLAVVDVSGRGVANLVDGVQAPGRYQVAWDGTNGGQQLAAGLYFVRFTAPDRSVVRKLATIR